MRYYRKVIRITAEASPNVRYALAQREAGVEPTDEVIVPGLLRWSDYQKRRATWDEVRQCIGLDAQFYKGAALLLFPPDWLNRAAEIAVDLRGRPRHAEAIGVDCAEGGDKSSWAATDRRGIIELISKKTPDTNVIPRETIAFMHRHRVPADRVVFDRGGGGKEHADRLRAMGHPVRTVAFGESLLMEIKRSKRLFQEKVDNREERYTYKNRRVQMFWELSLLLDPVVNTLGFAIPGDDAGPAYVDLRHQLSVFPKLYDEEGRCILPPKNKREGSTSKVRSLVELIGHSPDEADSVVLAVHGMTHKAHRPMAGVV